MLAYFPHPYPDELLYSVIARYHAHTGSTSPKMTLYEVFGVSNITAVVDLPANIDSLVKNVPTGARYAAEDIIYNNTLYPFYAPFLGKQKAKDTFDFMCGANGGVLHSSMGIMASSIPSFKYLRFCPACLKEDYKQFGETYWRRIHNTPGVFMCVKHEIPLCDSSIRIQRESRQLFVAANVANCIGKYLPIKHADKDIEILLKVAKETEWLLHSCHEIYDGDFFRDKYVTALGMRDLISPKGHFVHQKELIDSFKAYYGEIILGFLHSEVNYEEEDNWLKSITRKHRKVFHPLRHILMSLYLFGDLEQMFTDTSQYRPFGNGPWPCLNAVSPHYLQEVITKNVISCCTDTRKPVGTFYCDCGFIYSRRGSDADINDRYKIGRIKSFGPVWEEALRQIASTDISLREAARRLHVDPATVKKYAGKLKLESKWNIKPDCKTEDTTCSKTDATEMRDLYRRRWIELQDRFPEKSKTELRKEGPSIYTWLYRHDREWLNQFSPVYKKTINPSERVDWNLRDEEVLRQVVAVVTEIRNAKKPRRITISRVGAIIGARALLEKHLKRLPKTKRFLEQKIESVEQFQIRRIGYIFDKFRKSNETVAMWKIYRIAGVRFRSDDNGIVRKSALKKLS